MTIHACSTDAPAADQAVHPGAVLHLVRHGQSTWNAAGRVQGQSARAGGLTAAGRAEARRSAALLTERHPDAGRIVTSDLDRARETAEIIAGVLGLPVEPDPDLREQRLGDLEGRRFDDRMGTGTVQDAVDRLWRHPHRRPRGGESVADLYLRVRRALARHRARLPVRELVVVTHGGPVRVATATADPRTCRPVPRRAVGNASISSLDGSWTTPPPGGAGAGCRCAAGHAAPSASLARGGP
jgi:probable phosphoglycerate mutase